MKEHHFGDTGVGELLVAVGEAVQMQTADRAPGKPAKLQMGTPRGAGTDTGWPVMVTSSCAGILAPVDSRPAFLIESP
ncbi:hypothetical protein NIIDMKKI_65720 [Mycobacterium kansasii]|uniref:Uncharacterized protein n=1 Tax=Mycobacterium kansasii TaxID=1768 RepID=A0A7G1IK26_MYCKA|nr:hypothetical protein NIIDMKKI_65720 [Mycobacterium kansasii]